MTTQTDEKPSLGQNWLAPSEATPGVELLSDLGRALDDAESFSKLAAHSLSGAARRAAAAVTRIAELERRLVELEADSQELQSVVVTAEQRASRLMSMYVAIYQLHATLDPVEVRATITEIAINLLGAESFALILREDEDCPYDIALWEGPEQERTGVFGTGIYLGGDPMIDATLADGLMRLEPMEGARALACVPLAVQGNTGGALVVLKLLGHRPPLSSEDRDLLDLLAAHTGSALVASQAHAAVARKARTLAGLMKLASRT